MWTWVLIYISSLVISWNLIRFTMLVRHGETIIIDLPFTFTIAMLLIPFVNVLFAVITITLSMSYEEIKEFYKRMFLIR